MKKKLSRKRGFTLVEMIITLAVTIILVTSIASLIVAVVNERMRSGNDYNVSADIYFAENAVYDWFDNFAGDDSVTLAGESGRDGKICGITATVPGEATGVPAAEYRIFFDARNKRLITPKYTDGWTFSKIIDIDFEIYAADADGAGADGAFGKDVIKVNITYDGSSVPVSILLSGRASR